jgi:hypothetical protein
MSEEPAGQNYGDSRNVMATIQEEDGDNRISRTGEVAPNTPKQRPESRAAEGANATSEFAQGSVNAATAKLPHRSVRYSQSSCPICLEDFVSHSTVVRSLPCTHIFHPDCIDPVLRQYSSHCPVCKGKVLPVGYCPELTISMVRRERLIRRLRERVDADDPPHSSRSLTEARRTTSFYQRRLRAMARTQRLAVVSPQRSVDVEMVPQEPASPVLESLPALPRPAHTSREEWATQRANELLGGQQMAEDEHHAREAMLPRCEFPSTEWNPAF